MSAVQPRPDDLDEPDRWQRALREIMAGSAVRVILSILLGFVAGAVMLVVTDATVMKAAGYFFARPGDTIQAALEVVGRGYGALIQGSIFNFGAPDFSGMIFPLTETLTRSAPLIAAGLGIALSFRVGLFNIGGQGQVLFGAAFSAYVSFQWHLPFVLHLIVAMVIGILASMALGAFVGFLKAKTGAHEVIVTIMLNYIAYNLVTFLMRTPVLQDPSAGGTPKTRAPLPSAQLPRLLGDAYNLNLGIILVILAAGAYWWIMERSSEGYRFRAVGLNPGAARTAGIDVGRTYVVAMAVSAAFVGLAGTFQSLGRDTGFTNSIDSGIGFDAITVALLGGSSAGGVFAAGIFFGAMRAGGPAMQNVGVDPELLGIVQGLIVLFIAAPPLVRAIFRLPDAGTRSSRRPRRAAKHDVASVPEEETTR